MTSKLYFPILMCFVFLTACQLILEDQYLPGQRQVKNPEQPEIEYAALTFSAVKQLNKQPFDRSVIDYGIGNIADIVSVESILDRVKPPPSTSPIVYRIGPGDVLELVLFNESVVRSKQTSEQSSVNRTLNRNARVSADGTVLFIETGLIKLGGLTLEQAREQVANALIRNGKDSRFQLEFIEFNSQRVSLRLGLGFDPSGQGSTQSSSISNGTATFPITDRPLTLREMLVDAGLEISLTGVQVALISRGGKSYEMPVEYIFNPRTPEYYLTGGDTVRIEIFPYKNGKAYAMGGQAKPVVFDLNPTKRDTLADILFAEGGAFATRSVRPQEIFLLRGTSPVIAYHLDAQDPSRLRVAAELELRPKDIVFVSSKPIFAAREVVGLITPIILLDQLVRQ